MVNFGGTPAASFIVVSPTTITAIVGNGNHGDVSVGTSGGIASFAGFTFIPTIAIPAPFISAISPATAGQGEVVTITGSNFNNATAVSFGGSPALSFTVVSPTIITAVVGSGNSGDVSVTTPGGTATFAGFVYKPETIERPTDMTIYPNPTINRHMFWVKHPVSESTTRLQVIDMNGKVLKTIEVPAGTFLTQVYISDLKAGCYEIVLRGAIPRRHKTLLVQ